jgi:hypothetical protein
MNQRILELLARHPMQRTAQLADRLDISADQADTLLRSHLVAGVIVEHEVTAPNNRPAMAYELSEQFKLTDAYRAIVAHSAPTAAAATAAVAAASIAAPLVTPTFVPTAAPAAPPTATAKPARQPAGASPVPAVTKVDRAIDCVKQHGAVLTGQLRVAMNLRPGQHPAAYLATALRDGRIKREGECWSLSDGPAALDDQDPAPQAKKDALESGAALGQVQTAPTPAPAAAPAASESVPSVLTITLVEEPMFTAHVGGAKVPSLRLVSEWNGMKELRDPQGRGLIVDCDGEGHYKKMIDKMLGLDSTQRKATVIKGHPDLVAALRPDVNAPA